jgi:hypothetical protein
MTARERDPITRQRSAWRPMPPIAMGGIYGECHRRQVGDGHLDLVVAKEPTGWHLSISHLREKRNGVIEHVRYPRWDEIAEARDAFLPADRTFVMVLPREGEYLAVHPTTFHLHELTVELAQLALHGGLR